MCWQPPSRRCARMIRTTTVIERRSLTARAWSSLLTACMAAVVLAGWLSDRAYGHVTGIATSTYSVWIHGHAPVGSDIGAKYYWLSQYAVNDYRALANNPNGSQSYLSPVFQDAVWHGIVRTDTSYKVRYILRMAGTGHFSATYWFDNQPLTP